MVVVVLSVLTIWFVNKSSREEKSDFKIGIVYLLEHPSIREGLDGIEKRLDQVMHETKVNFSIRTDNGNGDMATIRRIIASYEQGNFDVIMALTTPVAKIAQNDVKDTPIVFVGITDPVREGLVDSLSKGKGNLTGTTSRVQSVRILQKAIELFPRMKKVGVLYSPSESNSIAILDVLDQQVQALRLPVQIIRKEVLQTTDIQKITIVALQESDALFVINDSKIVASVEILIQAALRAHKPIFASDISSVRKGALFAYGLDYGDEGIAAANIVKQILLDKIAPSRIPVFINERNYFYVNKNIIDKYNVSATALSNATIVE